MSRLARAISLLVSLSVFAACSDGGDSTPVSSPDAATVPDAAPDSALAARDPATAEKVAVDRFTDQAAMLQRRSAAPTLPGPNQPIDFDQGPFITHGYGPGGEKVTYYNFD